MNRLFCFVVPVIITIFLLILYYHLYPDVQFSESHISKVVKLSPKKESVTCSVRILFVVISHPVVSNIKEIVSNNPKCFDLKYTFSARSDRILNLIMKIALEVKFDYAVILAGNSNFSLENFQRIRTSVTAADNTIFAGETGTGGKRLHGGSYPILAHGVVFTYSVILRLPRELINQRLKPCTRGHGSIHDYDFGVCMIHIRHNIVKITEPIVSLTHLDCSHNSAVIENTIFAIISDSNEECIQIQQGWGKDIHKRIFLFSQKKLKSCRDSGMNVITMLHEPHLYFRHRRPYEIRPFQAIRWLLHLLGGEADKATIQYRNMFLNKNTWILGFDSDTWWNINALPNMLNLIEAEWTSELKQHKMNRDQVGLVAGYGYDSWGIVYPTGGAGIILDVAAGHAILKSLYEFECTMQNRNFDLVLADCAAASKSAYFYHIDSCNQGIVAELPPKVLEAQYTRLTLHKVLMNHTEAC